MLYNVSSNLRIDFAWDMHNKYHNIPTEYEKLIFLVKIHKTHKFESKLSSMKNITVICKHQTKKIWRHLVASLSTTYVFIFFHSSFLHCPASDSIKSA